MEKIKKILLYLPLLLLIDSCLSPIDFKVNNQGGIVIVSGKISTLDESHVLSIGLSASSNRVPIPITNALVFLIDDQGSRLRCINLENGKYQLPEGFKAAPSISYLLEISLPDGRVYQSKPEKVPDLVGTGKTSFTVTDEETTDIDGTVRKRNMLEIYTDVSLPKKGLFIHWSVEELFVLVPTDFPDVFNTIPPNCYVTNLVDPQRITLYNGSEVNATEINKLYLGKREINKAFLTRYVLTVKQSSISNLYYEYLRKVNILVNQSGSIFDTPPASIVGNFTCITNPSEIVLGYFHVENVSFDRISIFPFDIPFYIAPNCTYDPTKPEYLYDRECLNCSSVSNSSTIPPPWL
ncbi:MAG TPA: DUF4249 family protein [Cyclobacteriaceae bacterium]|nr:DUF4249 family protein [Cyclobacteriaceae bacterium]HPW61279.1 DUF4249 family protein [Cyclobacteriaceae bacterium]